MINNKTSLKGIKMWVFSAFSALLFWKYCSMKESYKKEVMIYECVLFHRLLFSHIVFVFSIMALIQVYLADGNTNVGSIVFMLMFFSFCHWVIQLIIGIPYYSREDLKRSKERWAAYNEYLKTRPRTSFDDFMDDLISVFFGTNDYNRQGQGTSHNRSTNHGDYAKTNNSENKNEIEKILVKFELPADTTDFTIVKNRFRQLAKKYHPDMPRGNEEMFKKLMLDFDYLNEYFINRREA